MNIENTFIMENLPENWKLVEEYEGNFIFEDVDKEFSVSVDKMGDLTPPYEVNFQQLKGTFIKIGFESGAYSTHAFNENEALERAVKMMVFINKKV